MTKNFSSFGQMAAQIALLEIGTLVALHEGLEVVAQHVEKKAKAEFGRYQDEVGPFPEWAQLADATQDERERLGFTPNDPLLRTGELKDSIGHKVEALEAVIGSTSEIMPFHEFGTAKMPPRPVLGPAAFTSKKKIESVLGAALVTGLVGGSGVHPSLGYDFETQKVGQR